MPQKMKIMGKKVTDEADFQRTTVRIYKLDLVQLFALANGETFNRYINRLIKQDILRNGDEKTIIKMFKD